MQDEFKVGAKISKSDNKPILEKMASDIGKTESDYDKLCNDQDVVQVSIKIMKLLASDIILLDGVESIGNPWKEV